MADYSDPNRYDHEVARQKRLRTRIEGIEIKRFCNLCGAKIKKGFAERHVGRCQ